MNCYKFLLILIVLICGTFGHRFGRHLINESVMDGAIGKDIYDVDSRDILASDDNDEDGVVILTESNEKVDVELLNGKLEFKFCSDGCMDQYVSVCFDAAMGRYKEEANGQCGTYQCEFRAGVRRADEQNLLWFRVETTQQVFDVRMCTQAVMNFPSTPVAEFSSPAFCEPLKHDTKLVTLYVHKASTNCPLKVIGAKRWYPPTSTTPLLSNVTAPTSLSVSSETSTSDSNMGLWIGLGIIGGIVVLAVLVGLGYCIYRNRKQKKAAAVPKQIQPIPPKAIDAPPAPTPMPVMKEEPAKEVTKEPSKAEPEKPKKVKAEPKKEGKKKETAADKAYAPMPFLGKKETEHDEKESLYEVAPAKQRTAETQQETPSNGNDATNEAVEDTTTNASIDHKPGLVVTVCDEPLLPRKPYNSNVERNYDKSRKSGSLSARHDPLLEKVLEDLPYAWKQCYEKTRLSRKQVHEAEEKYTQMKAFCPAYKKPLGHIYMYKRKEEASIFCFRVSEMMKKVAQWIMVAEAALKQRGAAFGKDGRITVFPKKQILDYLLAENTPSYIRSFAFGAYFHREIDAVVDGKGPIYSIPLLFVIVMQRRYTVESRRKACAWIRRQMLIILKCYHRNERKELAYPICAIETAWELDRNNFVNVSNVHTESEDERPPKLHRDVAKKLETRKKITKEKQ